MAANASQNGAVMPNARASNPPAGVPSAAPPRSNRKYTLLTRPRGRSGTTRRRSDTVTTPPDHGVRAEQDQGGAGDPGPAGQRQRQLAQRLDDQAGAQQHGGAEPGRPSRTSPHPRTLCTVRAAGQRDHARGAETPPAAHRGRLL
jgi:hypothetical protein